MKPERIMKCGHLEVGRDQNGNSFCTICYGINNDAITVAEEPELKNRVARCIYYGLKPRKINQTVCTSEEKSNKYMDYFRYMPEKEYDEFYCGCRGW